MKNFIILLCLLFTISNAQKKIDEKIVFPGVVHKTIINSTDTLMINVLKVNLSQGRYYLSSVKAKNLLNEREKTSDISKALSDSGYQVIAALNADFFEQDGEVINNMISEGKFVKAVKFTDSPFNTFVNSQLAITYDNKLLLEQFVFSGNVFFPDGTIEEIRRINSKADSNSITIYNSFQGNYTPVVPETWAVSEVLLIPAGQSADTTFFTIGDSLKQAGHTEIPNDGFIISANNKYAYYLSREFEIGDTIKLLLKLNPNFTNIRSLTGGWPQLVKDGKSLIKSNLNIEGVIQRFSENRHPRTGVGFSKDSTTVYFITVDGRQQMSRGMSLLEFADLMIDEGIYQGLNLDGGGSTTMIINNKVVNSPSDNTGERAVGNCLVLIREE
ncbi:MAG: phosphodiester glycosidase family protein [Ignavibacteriales bacterium]|nr:phosphodiester glycosidase family protein [Ignavibacteriales bacterium]